MKIIVFTRNTPRQKYFVNRINAEFGVDALFLVIRQKIAPKHFMHSIRTHWKKGRGTPWGAICHYFFSKKQTGTLATLYPEENEKESLQKKVLKDNYRKLNYNGPIHKDYDVNSSYRSAIHWARMNPSPDDALRIPEQILDMAGISKTELAKELALFISDEELVEMNGFDWVEIGDHGFQHLPMIKLPNKRLNIEIERSNKRIKSILKQKIDMFSFLFGARGPDFDERCIRIAIGF